MMMVVEVVLLLRPPSIKLPAPHFVTGSLAIATDRFGANALFYAARCRHEGMPIRADACALKLRPEEAEEVRWLRFIPVSCLGVLMRMPYRRDGEE